MHIDRERLKQEKKTDKRQELCDLLPFEAFAGQNVQEQTEDASLPDFSEQPEQQANSLSVTEQGSETEVNNTTVSGKKKKKKRSAAPLILLIAAVVILLACIILKIYLGNFYPYVQSVQNLNQEHLNVSVDDNEIAVRNPALSDQAEKTGIIFYAEFRVQPEAYLPLMAKTANFGYDCFLPKASGNQTYLNVDGAESIIRQYPETTNWYLVAHGKACDAAGQYAAAHPEEIKGLIFLGGDTQTNLAGSRLSLLCISGSSDTVFSQNQKEPTYDLHPDLTNFVEIDGANHSGFTDIPLMRGDSPADISIDEQTSQTASLIHQFIQIYNKQ